MWKSYKVIKNITNERTCIACPTQYEIFDDEGTEYYFRLRHGVARFDCYGEDTDETLAHGEMEGFDGYCTFDDMRKWLVANGITLLNSEEEDE